VVTHRDLEVRSDPPLWAVADFPGPPVEALRSGRSACRRWMGAVCRTVGSREVVAQPDPWACGRAGCRRVSRRPSADRRRRIEPFLGSRRRAGRRQRSASALGGLASARRPTCQNAGDHSGSSCSRRCAGGAVLVAVELSSSRTPCHRRPGWPSLTPSGRDLGTTAPARDAGSGDQPGVTPRRSLPTR